MNEYKSDNFPDFYTIDDEGLYALCYFLKDELENKTVKIIIGEVEETVKALKL